MLSAESLSSEVLAALFLLWASIKPHSLSTLTIKASLPPLSALATLCVVCLGGRIVGQY